MVIRMNRHWVDLAKEQQSNNDLMYFWNQQKPILKSFLQLLCLLPSDTQELPKWGLFLTTQRMAAPWSVSKLKNIRPGCRCVLQVTGLSLYVQLCIQWRLVSSQIHKCYDDHSDMERDYKHWHVTVRGFLTISCAVMSHIPSVMAVSRYCPATMGLGRLIQGENKHQGIAQTSNQ